MRKVINTYEELGVVEIGDVVEKNFGTVEINYGQIKKNYGIVIINRDGIEGNCKGAVVRQNFGKVKSNDGSITRDYTNDSMEINQKIGPVTVEKGIKYGVKH
ncbi:hypothetical protein [Candidatus Mesenet endosymbiont of Phosphuga atrata]|uniref:hypothetical protein n=1 Tax=Candidatus Mesenet endosymbiont of Phosphuga atrata TaxID=3066221 RepID=UPI0030D54A94